MTHHLLWKLSNVAGVSVVAGALHWGVRYTGVICDEKTPILSLACHIGKGGAGQKCVKTLRGKVLHDGLDDPDTAPPPRKARQRDTGIATSTNSDG